MTSPPLKASWLNAVARFSANWCHRWMADGTTKNLMLLHGAAKRNMDSAFVVMATKCQGVKELCCCDGYELVCDPLDHHQVKAL